MKPYRLTKPWEWAGARYCTGSDGRRVCTGAMMGRSDCLPLDRAESVKLHLVRVRPCDGGDYDKGGAYWGSLDAMPLYCAHNLDVVVFVRAKDRDAARVLVQKKLPNARFYRR